MKLGISYLSVLLQN